MQKNSGYFSFSELRHSFARICIFQKINDFYSFVLYDEILYMLTEIHKLLKCYVSKITTNVSMVYVKDKTPQNLIVQGIIIYK